MQALQTALTHAVMGGLTEYHDISHVLVAELPDASVWHEAAVVSLIPAIAPGARVTSLPLSKASSKSA
jgi:hypothetical protein